MGVRSWDKNKIIVAISFVMLVVALCVMTVRSWASRIQVYSTESVQTDKQESDPIAELRDALDVAFPPPSPASTTNDELPLYTATSSEASTELPGQGYGVLLREVFELHRGERVYFRDEPGLALVVVDFINSPCPQGAQCIWSGQSVVWELERDGKKLTDVNNLFRVMVLDSDYTTYARFQVEKVSE